MPGCVPKRSDQRRRRNKPEIEIEKGQAAEHVDVPAADPAWHEIARDWYESLALSGQSGWYEPSDWQTARYVAEAMSRNLESGRFSAQLFASVMQATTSLLATEGDRRRLRIELERGAKVDVDEDAAVASIDDYRAQLAKA